MMSYMDWLRKGIQEKVNIIQLPYKLRNKFKNIVKVTINLFMLPQTELDKALSMNEEVTTHQTFPRSNSQIIDNEMIFKNLRNSYKLPENLNEEVENVNGIKIKAITNMVILFLEEMS